MRKAFSMIELVFIIVMIGILAGASIWYLPRTNLKQAAESIINNLKYTKTLAQLDDRFFGISDTKYFDDLAITDKANAQKTQMEHYQCGYWQFQFHQSAGKSDTTTINTYSIFADNAGSGSKNFDGKPIDGDIIARDPMTKACISGYNSDNIKECEDNFSPEARFGNTFGVELDNITSDDCGYAKNSTFSIFFDGDGMPYCKSGQANCTTTTKPKRLTKPVTITLKRKQETAYICITPSGLIDGGNVRDKNGNARKTTDGKLRGIPVQNGKCQEEGEWLK